MIRRFNRFELKYIIHAKKRDAIRSDLLRNMRPDSYGGAEGFYRVTSLYHDTADLACFWSKVEGIKYRRKVRIRIYGRDASSTEDPSMVEIKQRINRTVQKRRLALPLGHAHALCDGRFTVPLDDPRDVAVATEVEFLARVLQLRPACVISYLRQAYVGLEHEPGLRITFDEDLSCHGPELGLGPGAESFMFMPPEWLIMEVKVNDRVPLWISNMLARHGCGIRRISKYCAGLARMCQAKPARAPMRGVEWTSFSTRWSDSRI